MRQTLFYIPMEVCGLPIFGFGILFWLIVACLVYRSVRTLWITKRRDDFWSDLFVGGVGIAIVAWIAPALNGGLGLPVRGYGVFLMLAILCSAIFVIFRSRKKWNIPPELIISIIVVEVVSGIIGARLFYVAEYWKHFVEYDPEGHLRLGTTLANLLNLTQGGLVVFGSIVVGILTTLFYLWLKKLPVLGTVDLFAPALLLGIAIGRLGCFMNGCCFGGICDTVPPGVVFPIASPSHYYQMEHGKSSLGGFNLFMPDQSKSEEKNLFHFKKKDEGLMAAPTGEPIVVESVDEQSNPEKAGLKPGMTILRAGALFPLNGSPTQAEIDHAEMFTPVGTRGFLNFLYDNGFPVRLPTLVLDVREPNGNADEEDEPNEETDKAEKKSPKTKRIAFRPGPFEVRAVHPTQLYSTLSALFLCGLLLIIDRYTRKDGVIFASFLILYPISRFLIEMVRTDEPSFMGTGLSVSQCISVLVFLSGLGVLAFSLSRKGAPAYEGRYPVNSKE